MAVVPIGNRCGRVVSRVRIVGKVARRLIGLEADLLCWHSAGNVYTAKPEDGSEVALRDTEFEVVR